MRYALYTVSDYTHRANVILTRNLAMKSRDWDELSKKKKKTNTENEVKQIFDNKYYTDYLMFILIKRY